MSEQNSFKGLEHMHALSMWATENTPAREKHAFLDGWDAAMKSRAIPDGFVMAPKEATTEIVVAIEAAIDSQLIASAMSPADMFRQDGDSIYRAMIQAAQEAE